MCGQLLVAFRLLHWAGCQSSAKAMETMILVGQYDSPFVRRVAITLSLYGMAFERKVLSVFTDFEAVLAINPLGKVPVLELTDGERLFDSRMILDYLDELVDRETSLMPRNRTDRLRVLRVEAVALGLAEKSFERGIEFARRNPEKIDIQWAERLKRQILSALSWLENLQPSPWLCCDRLTRADITCAVTFTFLREKQQITLAPGVYPALEAHCAHCEGLPEFKASPYSAVEAASSGWRPREL